MLAGLGLSREMATEMKLKDNKEKKGHYLHSDLFFGHKLLSIEFRPCSKEN
jgi:hypothetical protein